MKTITANIRIGLAILGAGVSVVSHADAQFEINVSNAQFTTYVMVEGGSSRMTVSPVPISDEIHGSVSGLLNAQASAEMFGVSAYTSIRFEDAVAGAHHATAAAESQIRFSPVTSGTANIEFDFIGKYCWWWSHGSLSLVDTTSDQTLWHYEWSGVSAPIPVTGYYDSDGATRGMLSCITNLSAEHTYTLDMFLQTGADDDVELVSVQVSGLHVTSVVPEPSVFALVGLGLAFFPALRQRKSSAH